MLDYFMMSWNRTSVFDKFIMMIIQHKLITAILNMLERTLQYPTPRKAMFSVNIRFRSFSWGLNIFVLSLEENGPKLKILVESEISHKISASDYFIRHVDRSNFFTHYKLVTFL